MRPIFPLGALLLALAEGFGSCHLLEDNQAPIPERVIRIEIEGCKEESAPRLAAVALVSATAAVGTQVARTPTGTPTSVASTEPAPVAPAGGAAPSTELGKQLQINNLRELIGREIKRKSLSRLDIPEVAAAQMAAASAIGQGNEEEALRQLTAAESELRRVSIDRSFVSQRLDRVKRRIEEGKGFLAGNEPALRKDWQDAEDLFLRQQFERANEKLDAIDTRMDSLPSEPKHR